MKEITQQVTGDQRPLPCFGEEEEADPERTEGLALQVSASTRLSDPSQPV